MFFGAKSGGQGWQGKGKAGRAPVKPENRCWPQKNAKKDGLNVKEKPGQLFRVHLDTVLKSHRGAVLGAPKDSPFFALFAFFVAIQFRNSAALVPSFMPGCVFATRRGGFGLIGFAIMTTGSHWQRSFWSAIFAASVGASAPGAEPPKTPPGLTGRNSAPANFQTNSIEGWRVLVNERLLAEDKAATEKALELLRGQLQEIVRVVPAPAVAKLREVPLWFSPEYPGVKPRAEYHPGAGWLRDNGRDPVMAKGVEFTDVKHFEAETKRMPNFTLHELAHGYHDRVLDGGFDHAEIKAAYGRAKASKSYDKVERWFGNGRASTKEKAYAMTNPMEYFAETTEAFFSRNDFFPFTREELKQHDPEMEKLLERLWGGPKKTEEDEKKNGR